jgi:hypothetical protein
MNDDDQRQRQNIAVAVAAILLVVLGAWGLIALKKSTDRLDCYAAHHRNCDPVPQSE